MVFGAAFAVCFVVSGLAFGCGVDFDVDFRVTPVGAGDFVVVFGFAPAAPPLGFAIRCGAGVALAGDADLRGCCLAAEAVA
ncbi:MAG TPA: hypothetical protein VF286_12865 [Acidiphilium sp.]